jgi:pSer/pThr/pTyr-binding forkhead associated (FHA) protein
MAKLHFSLEGNSLGEFSLDKERTTIGRRPTNDIHIDNLSVSGDHAVILTIGNDSFLEDLNSTNGTLVNKKVIKKHVLHHGDIIEFGKYQLKYVNKTQEKMPTNHGGFENTVVMRPAKLVVSPEEVKVEQAPKVTSVANAPLESKPAPAPTEPTPIVELMPVIPTEVIPKLGHLQILSGTNSGQDIVLNKTLTTLGKPGIQIAVITKRPHGYFISHVEGESHPLVNGQNIGAQAYALSDHDVIDLIDHKMEFYLS